MGLVDANPLPRQTSLGRHMHGSLGGQGGPMAFYSRVNAEEQAASGLDDRGVYVPVRIVCTAELGTGLT